RDGLFDTVVEDVKIALLQPFDEIAVAVGGDYADVDAADLNANRGSLLLLHGAQFGARKKNAKKKSGGYRTKTGSRQRLSRSSHRSEGRLRPSRNSPGRDASVW